MNHRAVRVTVFLLAVASAAAGAYLLVALEDTIVAERSAERVYESQAHEAALLVERLRTAQQSYVAAGQGADYWIGKLADTRATLERTLAGLATSATADGARTAADRAAGLVGQHARLDARARTYISQEQRLMASDLIFTEMSGMTAEIARYTDHARTEQRALADARVAELRQQQTYVLGGAAALGLLCTLLLVARGRSPAPEDTREALRALMNDGSPAGSAALRAQPGTTPGLIVQPGRTASVIPIATAGGGAALASAASVDLAATARLCADLARVGDPAELPRLLERAARIIDASGLIVWVADRAGTSLFPILAEGYAPHVIARMGSIGRDADNAAAAAYRQGELRTVPAHDSLPGAIVAPIITGDGCVGVLAAEMRHGTERDEATQAITAILAAQLATFVTAVPAGQDTK
jgi:hypothetical protein